MKQMSATRTSAAMFAALLVMTTVPQAAHAQLQPPVDMIGARIGASIAVFAPLDAMIVSGGGRDTRLGAGTAFSLDVQYGVAGFAALYVGGTAAFSTLARGTEFQPAASAGSDHVMMGALTGGAVLGYFGLHPTIAPTLRLGGGIKMYSFDVDGAESHTRPTADIGVGLRGGAGPFDVGAEIRYLPSTFDQARLPTRGIIAQQQRQTDVLLSLAIGLRM
jgi:hypothetical protein